LLARLGQPAAQFGSLLALSVRFGLVPELVLALALVIHTLIQPHRSVRGAPHLGEQGVPGGCRQLAACLLQSLSHLPRSLQLADVHKFSILLLVRSVRRRLAQVPPVVGYGGIPRWIITRPRAAHDLHEALVHLEILGLHLGEPPAPERQAGVCPKLQLTPRLCFELSSAPLRAIARLFGLPNRLETSVAHSLRYQRCETFHPHSPRYSPRSSRAASPASRLFRPYHIQLRAR